MQNRLNVTTSEKRDDSLSQKATKQNPYENSLGMKFVPVAITGGPTDGQRVLFSIWETRYMDYETYANSQAGIDQSWRESFNDPRDRALCPVVHVSWEDARAFCEWLTNKERREGRIGPGDEYRLPSDHEWSCAVGIGAKEDAADSPQKKNREITGYPWGDAWPPPVGAGNFESDDIDDYNDQFSGLAPVGSFLPNPAGLYDLSGNVWEWCLDLFGLDVGRVVRGGSFFDSLSSVLSSSYRIPFAQTSGLFCIGFRCVLVLSGDGTPGSSSE